MKMAALTAGGVPFPFKQFSCLLLLVCLSSVFADCNGNQTKELNLGGNPMPSSRHLRENIVIPTGFPEIIGQLASQALPKLSRSKLVQALQKKATKEGAKQIVKSLNNSLNRIGLQARAYAGDYLPIFYVQLELGDPPQKVNVTISTNTELFWVQCKPCVNCDNSSLPPQPLFLPSSSTSFRRVPCNVPTCSSSGGFDTGCSNSACNYSDPFSVGDFSLDTITMSSLQGLPSHMPDVAFGCGQESQDDAGRLKLYSTSGILGLGRGNMSFLLQLKGKYGRRFLHCFPHAVYQQNAVGSIFFGDYDLPAGRLSYTPLVTNRVLPSRAQLYYVNLTSISVDGKALSIPQSAFEIDISGNGGTIIDPTALFTYLTDDSYLPLREAFERSITNLSRVLNMSVADEFGLEVCYNLSVNATELPKTPAVTFVFQDGATIELREGELWVPLVQDDKEATMCMAIGRANSMQVGVNIIGNFQQSNLAVEYDVDKFKIGFAKADCSPSSSTQLYPTHMALLSILLLVMICFYG